MRRIFFAVAITTLPAVLWSSSAAAQACAQEVIGNLFAELEAIDVAGETRLKSAIDKLSQQESWSEPERSEYTASIADNPQVDAAESERTDIIGRLFGLVQRGEVDCAEIRGLHAKVLTIEREQWDAAVKQVDQRIWH